MPALQLKLITASRQISVVVEEPLVARRVDGASTDYLNDLRLRLGAFSRAFEGRVPGRPSLNVGVARACRMHQRLRIPGLRRIRPVFTA